MALGLDAFGCSGGPPTAAVAPGEVDVNGDHVGEVARVGDDGRWRGKLGRWWTEGGRRW